MQAAFLLLNLGIGLQFWLFVRWFERGGAGLHVPRPPGVEGWLPIAALMNLKAAVLTGELPRRFPAGVVLLGAFLAVTVAFRRAFCSWLCPVGTLSEVLWKLGRRTLGRTFTLARWVDVPLRSLKYLLLAFFLWAVGAMSVEAIQAFLQSPYGLVADVKMLNFFRHLGAGGAIVLSALALGSALVPNLWCRYLCPYGALHGLVSWLAPTRIRRDAGLCIDCAMCTRVCPSRLVVHARASVGSPECTGCLECVAACPVKDALGLAASRRRRLPGWAVAAGIAAVFLGLVALARLTGHWETRIDERIYAALVPRADALDHPR